MFIAFVIISVIILFLYNGVLSVVRDKDGIEDYFDDIFALSVCSILASVGGIFLPFALFMKEDTYPDDYLFSWVIYLWFMCGISMFLNLIRMSEWKAPLIIMPFSIVIPLILYLK